MHDASRRAVPVRIAHADRPCGAEMLRCQKLVRAQERLRLNRA